MMAVSNVPTWMVMCLCMHLTCSLHLSADSAASKKPEKKHRHEQELQQERDGGNLQSTAFILKMSGNFTDWQRLLIKDYQRALAPSHVTVGVLRDRSGFPGEDKVDRTTIQVDDINVQVCEVSWHAAEHAFGTDLLSNFRPDGDNGAHNVYEALWWKHCAPELANGTVAYAWFAKHDAFYNGNIATFVNDYAHDSADFIAAGFRIAGESWKNFHINDDAVNSGLRTFDWTSQVIRNLQMIPNMAIAGPCNDSSRDNAGLIFAQDMVERLSKKLFQILEEALGHGILASAEVFLPTLCASQDSKCTPVDFAPVFDRGLKSTPASPLYCGFGSLGTAENLCKSQFQKKWVSPLNWDHPQFPSCHPRAKLN